MKKPDLSKRLCRGCHNDWYNYNKGCNAVAGCWSFKTAQVVEKKLVSVDDRPPWDSQPVSWTLSCHKKPGHVWVEPNQSK